VANLEIFRTEPVFERIAGIAAIHTERLPRLSQNSAVGDARTIGTMAAIELRAGDAGYLSELRPKLYEYFLKRDILLRPLGNVIYILPPYCIQAEDLHRVYDVIEEGIGAIA
jgi:adenosylmethionine-8-amino-7-oxononanoate aminotransferase